MKMHATVGVSDGQLFVKCPFPGCGRSLQTNELKDALTRKDYNKLLQRMKEMEDAKVDSLTAEDIPEGMELRLCPRCHARIEKNDGCDSMLCYRCGDQFEWDDAQQLVIVSKPDAPNEDPQAEAPTQARNWASIVAGHTAGAAEAAAAPAPSGEEVAIAVGRGVGYQSRTRGRGRGAVGRGGRRRAPRRAPPRQAAGGGLWF
mmetsp:Transcript_15594/g.46244  ORF Transcript_15594/g.46244 Transcript_15594/m.46244 type:complete len:202 (-) Transcript_15594:1382-1987(-)